MIADLHGGVKAVGRCAAHVHPLRHAVFEAIESVANKHRESWPDNQPSDGSYLYTALSFSLSLIYRCTNYICVLPQEPCGMCSMALLHSRIAVVIFGSSWVDTHGEAGDLGGGALCSQYRLHCHAKLNHHFRVYQLHRS